MNEYIDDCDAADIDAIPEDDPGCVLGDRCLCPEPQHHSSDCYSVEDAEAMAEAQYLESLTGRAALCVKACEGLSDNQIRWGVVPRIVLDSAENALWWLHTLAQLDCVKRFSLRGQAAAKFPGMIEELTEAVNRAKPEGATFETTEEMCERFLAEAIAAERRRSEREQPS